MTQKQKKNRKELNKAYYEANRERLLEKARERRAKKSATEKRLYRHAVYLKQKEKGYDGNATYSAMSEEERKAYNKRRYERNKEEIKRKAKERYDSMTSEERARYNERKRLARKKKRKNGKNN